MSDTLASLQDKFKEKDRAIKKCKDSKLKKLEKVD